MRSREKFERQLGLTCGCCKDDVGLVRSADLGAHFEYVRWQCGAKGRPASSSLLAKILQLMLVALFWRTMRPPGRALNGVGFRALRASGCPTSSPDGWSEVAVAASAEVRNPVSSSNRSSGQS